MEYEVVIPLKTVSEANTGSHWAAKAKRVQEQRSTVGLLLKSARHSRVLKKHGKPSKITLTRYSSGTLDDDNLASALKAVRDGVQDALGINDRVLTFEYAQEKCKRGTYAVKIAFVWEVQ